MLALVTSSRHPGIAVVIASTIYPEKNLVIATVLLYLLVNIIISFLYLIWSKRGNKKMVIHPKFVTETMGIGRKNIYTYLIKYIIYKI